MPRDPTTDNDEWEHEFWLGQADSVALLGGIETPDEFILIAHRDTARVAIVLDRQQVEVLGKFLTSVDAFNAIDKALSDE